MTATDDEGAPADRKSGNGSPSRQPMTVGARRSVLVAVGVVIVAAGIVATSHADPPVAHRTTTDDTYCVLVKSYKGSLDKLQPARGAADLGSQLTQDIGLIEQAKNNAPEPIKGDMEVFAGAYAQVALALADTNFRPDAVGIEALQPLQSPAFEAALRNIATYDKRVCGIG